MLEDIEKDRSAASRRSAMASGHGLAEKFPAALVGKALYPLRFAYGRVMIHGSEIRCSLSLIAADATVKTSLRLLACEILADLDDARATTCLLSLYDAGILNDGEFELCLMHVLPQAYVRGREVADATARWVELLRDRFASTSLDDMRLEAYDAIFSEKTFVYFDELRWLDRVSKLDIDEWLRIEEPDAWSFRHAQLKLGYDPMWTIAREGASLDGDREVAEMGKALFEQVSDRKGFMAIVRARNRLIEIWAERDSGMEMARWYMLRRGDLRYDLRRQRFVVEMKSGGTRVGAHCSIRSQ